MAVDGPNASSPETPFFGQRWDREVRTAMCCPPSLAERRDVDRWRISLGYAPKVYKAMSVEAIASVGGQRY